jgi:hypothetical protein
MTTRVKRIIRTKIYIIQNNDNEEELIREK